MPGSLSGSERVTSLIQEANRRVHERSTTDPAASGMGTTMTVALVEGDDVAIGHVGDSRAYRLRERADRAAHRRPLARERADEERRSSRRRRPRRIRSASVITRALGTDPDVDVDAFTVDARGGRHLPDLLRRADRHGGRRRRSSSCVERNRDDLPKRGEGARRGREPAAAARTTSPSSRSRSRRRARAPAPRRTLASCRTRTPSTGSSCRRSVGARRRRRTASRSGRSRGRPDMRLALDDARPARARRRPARLGAGALSYRNRELGSTSSPSACSRRSASRASTSLGAVADLRRVADVRRLLPRALPRRAHRRAPAPSRAPTRTCCRSPACSPPSA